LANITLRFRIQRKQLKKFSTNLELGKLMLKL